jgi:hypothetical protein
VALLPRSFSLPSTISLNTHDIETSARVILPKMAFHFRFLFSFFLYIPCLVLTTIKTPTSMFFVPHCNFIHLRPFAVFLCYGHCFVTGVVRKKPTDHKVAETTYSTLPPPPPPPPQS